VINSILKAGFFASQVDLKFVRKLNRLIPLKELQSYPELSEMALVKRGRLSVQPVTEEEYNFILSQEDKDVDSK
jgi:predicted RNA-binding protein with PUA-like domain